MGEHGSVRVYKPVLSKFLYGVVEFPSLLIFLPLWTGYTTPIQMEQVCRGRRLGIFQYAYSINQFIC